MAPAGRMRVRRKESIGPPERTKREGASLMEVYEISLVYMYL
jgi:hypothetical protein